MTKLTKVTKVIDWIRKITIFLFFGFISYTILSENVLDYVVLTGLPIVHIRKLLIEHVLANILIFTSCLTLGIYYLKLYSFLKTRNIPFVGFIWISGVLKLFIASIFAMNIINIWHAFFWIDGAIRVATSLFAASSALSFVTSYKAMKTIKSPEEYQELRDELKRVRELHEDIVKIKVK